jgi:uncharacterized membrane protein (UPF0127 family)
MKKIRLRIAGADEKNPPLQIEVADSFFTRLRGLMGRKSLADGQGLLIAPCSSIHMCFMRFAIDAVYIDREYRVLKVVKGLQPWIGLSMCRNAWAVIELSTANSLLDGVKIGERLNVRSIN